MITIFTPTYNRGYIISKLYNSLCRQTSKDFEWIVVDDGSTDNTEEIIKSFISENKIRINYVKQDNNGKHAAINRGIALANGILFFIVDSDDYLTDNAVEWILLNSVEILDNSKFAGLSGTRIDSNGKRIGGEIDFNVIDSNAIDIRYKSNVKGDLAEIYKTEILRNYNFPTYKDEKFCPEALVWNRIAQKYNIRYFNVGIYICEYLPDGLTRKITKLRKKSPIASMIYYSELYRHKIPTIQKIKAAINFWRFANIKCCIRTADFGMSNIISLLCFVPGVIMKVKDIIK